MNIKKHEASHSSLITHHSYFCLSSGCKFSTKRSGVGNVQLVKRAASSPQRIVNQTLGGGGKASDERWVVRLECAEGALFEDCLREAFLVEADERDAQGGRVGDDEPLARESLVGAQSDGAQVGVARRLPVRLAEDVDALGDVGDTHVAINDRLHARELFEADVEPTAAVRAQQERVLDEQAEVFEAGHFGAEAEGRALVEVAQGDLSDRAKVFDPFADGGEGVAEHRELFHGRPQRAGTRSARSELTCIRSNLRQRCEFLVKVLRKEEQKAVGRKAEGRQNSFQLSEAQL